MPDEHIGEAIDVQTAQHPPRSDSPEYRASRAWLMKQPGGCYICGGPVDLSHPEAPVSAGMQDHHGGGLYHGAALVGFNLFPLEWSMGWGASPAVVRTYVEQLKGAGLVAWDAPIETTADVMAWVDSQQNANVRLCAGHHVGHQQAHTPDINGHEAVGIHNAPWPVLAAQATCDWTRFDMWGGTTGTLAVAPHPDGSRGVIVTYVHHSHPEPLQVGQALPSTHPQARAAHAPASSAH